MVFWSISNLFGLPNFMRGEKLARGFLSIIFDFTPLSNFLTQLFSNEKSLCRIISGYFG